MGRFTKYKSAACFSFILSLLFCAPGICGKLESDFLKAQKLRFENHFAEAMKICDRYITEKGLYADLTAKNAELQRAAWFALRGATKHDLKDYDGAVADFQQALALPAVKERPGLLASYNWRLGEAYRMQGRNKEAIARLSEALEKTPMKGTSVEANIVSQRGGLFLLINKPKEALADFDKSIAIWDAIINRSGNAGDIVGARSSRIKVMYERVKALEQMGKKEEAKAAKIKADKTTEDF